MPKNRYDRTHQEKATEILAIAERLFREQGYARTTVAMIAREAGIATNVVHWYFATKDDLFVAVLDSLQSADFEYAQRQVARSTGLNRSHDLAKVLTEFVWRRLDRTELITTLHERAHQSPAIAEFHERAHRRYEEGLELALHEYAVPAPERKMIVDTLISAIEGLVMHKASKRDAKRMMSFLADRLLGPLERVDQHTGE